MPEAWRLVEVICSPTVPLAQATAFGDWRPISLVPVLANLFEAVLARKIQEQIQWHLRKLQSLGSQHWPRFPQDVATQGIQHAHLHHLWMFGVCVCVCVRERER